MSLDTDSVLDHWPVIMGVMRRMMPRADQSTLEDLASDTIEKALRNAHRYQEQGSGPRGWLTTMAARIAIDHMQQRKVRTVHVSFEDWMLGTARLDAGSDRHATALDVQAAISTLPERQQQYVRLRFWEDCYLREIGPSATVFRLGNAAFSALRCAALGEAGDER